MKKRIICLSLIIAMLVVMSLSFASASNPMGNREISEWTTTELISAISDEDLFVPLESAEYYAEFFIRDLIATGITSWNENTCIINAVEMYDETGENITAYSFELNEGYIIVAASVDIENPVLEWADEAAPLYDEFDINNIEKIVYLGGYNYFIDDGENELEALSGYMVERSDVENKFEEMKNISNVSESMLELIVEEKTIAENETFSKAPLYNDNGAGRSTPGSNQYITDPFAHAVAWYGGGTFTCLDFANNWESYVNFSKTSDFPGYDNHCGPTAITNMVKTYYNRYELVNHSAANVFNNVVGIGTRNLYYTQVGGTLNLTANGFIKSCFTSYNKSVTINGQYIASYTNLKTSLTNDHRLAYLMMQGHDNYGDHHVLCYAYTRLGSTYRIATYFKVADGHYSNGGRYVDSNSVSSDHYWEVAFF